MRLTFVIRDLDRGGAQHQLLRTAEGFHQLGHDVDVVALRASDLRHDGAVTITDLGGGGVLRFPVAVGRLVRHVRRRDPDAVYAVMAAASVATLLAKPFFRSVPVVVGLMTAPGGTAVRNRRVAAATGVERLLLRFADAVVANSTAGAASAGDREPPVAVIPTGTDTARFRPDPEGRRDVRSSWGVASDTRVLGLVGRFDPVKGHDRFLEAAAILRDTGRDVRFVVVGGSGTARYEAEVRATASRLGLDDAVDFVGELSDTAPVYPALDVLVLSSEREGMPNVIIEAMSSGTPCVAFDVGDVAAALADVGEIAAGDSPAALADACARMLDRVDREPDLGAETRARAVARWSQETMVARHLDVFSAVLGG